MTNAGASESRVHVELGSRGYDVIVGAGVLANLGAVVSASAGARAGSRVFLAHDDGLPSPTIDSAVASLRASGLVPIAFALHASETEKTIPQLQKVLAAMAAHEIERREPVVALGGGIVGDLAGFAAAIYRRGLPVIQCPTTLLAMVDASVGGKTGVNLAADGPGAELQKNLIGAFHQPRAVIADVLALHSLPDRYFRAGLAECIKHGMIAADPDAGGGAELFAWTESNLPRILARDAAMLIELVSRNVRVKAAVVGRDEREEAAEDGRALLNLGHTFGHAIETIPGLSPDGNPASAPLQHGEAVALGLVAASRCAEVSGLCRAGVEATTRRALGACGLPTKVRGLPATQTVLRLMQRDKKVESGRLRLVLPTGPGRATVVASPPAAAVTAGIDAIRA